MVGLQLHHISMVSRDLEASFSFYDEVLGLACVDRPDFPVAGRCVRSGTVEVHLIDGPDGTFRTALGIDHNDVHFAIQVPDFEAEIIRFNGFGYAKGETASNGKHVRVNRNGKAG